MGRRLGFASSVFVSCMAALVALASSSRAQTTGSIAGWIADSSGSRLPGVTVEASSPRLQGVRVGVAGGDGLYRLPALPPGLYTVRASLPGFAPVEKTTTVTLDATSTLDITLRLSLKEEVLVSGESSRIDTTSTTTGTNYSARVIAHLPVDRNYADVVRANPGVITDHGDTQGRSLALSIYGSTSAENQWIIDGVNATNVQKGIQGKAINNEFIEEIDVKTGGYQAEYGGALGGVVNVITRSGGNAFHGDGMVYFDSNKTAARQIFTEKDSLVAETRSADYRRFDYGVDLGGYLLKDRLWFFGALDRVDVSRHVSRVSPSPHVSTEDRFPLDSTDNLYSGKLTWNVATPTTLVATVFADPSTSSGAAGVDPRQGRSSTRLENPVILNPDPSTWYSARRVGGTDYGLRLTQLFGSRALLTLQAAHHRDRNSLTAPDGVRTIDLTCSGGTPESPCSIPPVPNFVTGGYGTIDGPLDHNASHREQLGGDLVLYAGSHELKVGGGYEHGAGDATYSYTGGQEVTILSDFGSPYYQHSFVVRSPTDLTPVSGVRLHAKEWNLGIFLQDSWRPLDGLTVNLGLRWDEEHLIDYRGVTVLPLDNQWQPRLGVVWDPWRDGRTKLYAFAGRFYYTLPTVGTSFAFANFTVVWTYNFDPVSLAPDPSLGTPVVWARGGHDNVDRHIRGTHQDEFTIGLERMLAPTITMGLKATYRRLADAIEDRCDFQYAPDSDASGCAFINPGSGEKFAAGDAPVCDGFVEAPDGPQCTESGAATPPAKRLYRGVEVLARKSLGDKLWLQASYVYSSLRGNYDGAVNERLEQTTPGFNLDFDWPPLWRNAYGHLYLDRPHRFRLDGYWTTPLKLSLGVQVFAESGAPLDRLGYFHGSSDVFLLPRGSAGRLPTRKGANLTLAYPMSVGYAVMTFQAYVYNVLNNRAATTRDERWTLSPPERFPTTIYDPSQPSDNPEYGKITSRQDPRLFRAAVRVSF